MTQGVFNFLSRLGTTGRRIPPARNAGGPLIRSQRQRVASLFLERKAGALALRAGASGLFESEMAPYIPCVVYTTRRVAGRKTTG